MLLATLVAGTFSIVPVQQSSANTLVGAVNPSADIGTATGKVVTNPADADGNGSLFVATTLGSAAVAHTLTSTTDGHVAARSVGLYWKDPTSGVAQTATMLAGGVLSLYTKIATTTAISATGGTMSSPAVPATSVTSMIAATGGSSTAVAFTVTPAQISVTQTAASAVAVLYTAPSTPGTYTISLFANRGFGATETSTITNPLLGILGAKITVTVVSASHPAVGSANISVTGGTTNESMFVATTSNTGGLAVAATNATVVSTTAVTDARSTGLLSKDTTKSTAQTATVLTSGRLSLYAPVSTTVAFTASAGTFASTAAGTGTVTYSDPAKTSLVVLTAAVSNLGAQAVSTIWTAPSTVGTYTVSLYKHSGTTAPTEAVPSGGSLAAQITVTVVAASTGGTVSLVYSACNTDAYARTATGVDSTTSNVATGSNWFVNFALKDGYNAFLDAGSIVATATNGALLGINTAGTTATSTTASTAVLAGNGATQSLTIGQPTAGAPLTTTVTISYNGTTVCTKTVTIRGAASKVEIASVATGDLGVAGSSFTNTDWLDEGLVMTNTVAGTPRAGMYKVTLKDSAGNIVLPNSSAEFTMDPATTTTIIPALSVNSVIATSTSSTSNASYSAGLFSCGPTAGSSAVKLRYTNAATGVTITSDAFTARCADNPYTYEASFDKATYVQGDLATLTVKFKDSKGNAANSVTTPGPLTINVPFMTAVSATGSATMLTNAAGVKTYTFTVGTTSGMTAGTYTSIIDFTSLTAAGATKSTPTYKLTTGSTDVAFSEILKSVVALIASINKQIQALQKLILKR
jgi:hypothetical protein